MNKEKFYDTDLKEQEAITNIDYHDKKAIFYTSRKTVYKRMLKCLGEPHKVHHINNQITGAWWYINFGDKRINKIFSKSIIIGGL